MFNNTKNNLKPSCDRLSNHSKTCSSKNGKALSKTVIPKKILVSNKISNTFQDGKSCSTGVINKADKPSVRKPKKTTKSEVSFSKNQSSRKKCEDFCKNCGDYINHTSEDDVASTEKYDTYSEYNIPTIINSINSNIAKNDRSKSIQQYYKNENFNISTNSIIENGESENFRKVPLDTIKEDSEAKSKASEETVFRICTDSDSDSELDSDKQENVRKIKEFRQKNYFECHSVKPRIKTKGSVTSLDNHRCVYRFYLNDRLFPVPLNTDYNGIVRCVECHLPMDDKLGDNDEKVNGTIQAKVKLGKEVQDMTLLLPIKEPLIIKERRKEDKSKEEVVYFGVIKLDKFGDSVFNRVTPGDSLALKYQKGYKEFVGTEKYSYSYVDNNDVLRI